MGKTDSTSQKWIFCQEKKKLDSEKQWQTTTLLSPTSPVSHAQLHSWLLNLLPLWVVQGQWELGIWCQSAKTSVASPSSQFPLPQCGSPAPWAAVASVWVLQLLQSTSACCIVGTCSTMVLQGLQRISPFPKCVLPNVPAVLLRGSAVPAALASLHRHTVQNQT